MPFTALNLKQNWGLLGDKGLATEYLNNGQKGVLWINGIKTALAHLVIKYEREFQVAIRPESEIDLE